jgi:hypothetical protein
MQIAIIKVSSPCPSGHADIDPYWKEYQGGQDWNEYARADGRCYWGILETVVSNPDEDEEAFVARANEVAAQWDESFACPNCYRREGI